MSGVFRSWHRDSLAGASRLAHNTFHTGDCSRWTDYLYCWPFTAFSFKHSPAWSNKAHNHHVCSHQVCACLAAGLHATVAVVDTITFRVFQIGKVPFAKTEQALGMVTWSQPIHDTVIGMASLLCTLELSLPIKSQQTLYKLLGDAGGVVALLYILSRHYSVLWNRVLPAVTDHCSEKWVWPGPLRRGKTRRQVFKGCRDMLCIIFGLVALFLLLTNSAAPPSPLADKWFAASPRLRLETAADKQAASTHLVHQRSLPHLQLDPYLPTHTDDSPATCPTLSFAESCCSWMPKLVKQTPQHSQPNAVGLTPIATVLSTSAGMALEPTTRLTASSAPTTAHMPAQSRALVWVPRLPVCPAVFPSSVLIVEAQHTHTVHPVRPVPNFFAQASAHMENWSSMTTPAAADDAVTPSLPDLGCNGTLMCCLIGSLTQPLSTTTVAHATSASAALSELLKHAAAGSPYADFLPDLHSWSWLQTLMFGNFMFSLGFIIPGMCFLMCSKVLHLCGAAVACLFEVLTDD